jgi:hypothetical protein
VEFAGGVEGVVAIVSVEVPDPATELGAKLYVAPAGRLLALNATLPEKPPIAPMLTSKAVLPPPPEVCVPGVAEIEKSAFPCPPPAAPPLQDDSTAVTSRHDRRILSRIFDRRFLVLVFDPAESLSAAALNQ